MQNKYLNKWILLFFNKYILQYFKASKNLESEICHHEIYETLNYNMVQIREYKYNYSAISKRLKFQIYKKNDNPKKRLID